MATPNVRALAANANARRAIYRRLFKSGDLAIVMNPTRTYPQVVGRLVVVLHSQHTGDNTLYVRQTDPDFEKINFDRTGGVVAWHVAADCAQLVAAVDVENGSPSCDDYLNFIVGRGPHTRWYGQ